jgi:hypothetical protein
MNVGAHSKNRRYPRIMLPKEALVGWQTTREHSISAISTLGLGGMFISTPNLRLSVKW